MTRGICQLSKPEQVMAQLLHIRERATAFCFTVLGDFHAAEDAYQEAALVVVHRVEQYRDAGFDNWFWRIQRNVLGTYIQAAARKVILADPELLERMEKLFREDPAPGPQ